MSDVQEFNIPLDSPLDINMNDQLVSVERPTFKHNRQKLLGGLLQTSVRYEDDGYFAGWHKHSFVLVPTGDNYIEPNTDEDLLVHPKTTLKGVEYFIVHDRKTDMKFTFSPVAWEEWFTGSGTLTRHKDNLVISGSTQKGLEFIATVNIYTGEASLEGLGEEFYITTSIEDNTLNIKIDRVLKPQNDWFMFIKDKPLRIGEGTLNYFLENNVHTWGDDERGFTYNGTAVAGKGFFGDVKVKSSEEATLHIDYVDTTEAEVSLDIEYEELWRATRVVGAEPNTPMIGGASYNHDVNKQYVTLDEVKDGVAHITHSVPEWVVYYLKELTLGSLAEDTSGKWGFYAECRTKPLVCTSPYSSWKSAGEDSTKVRIISPEGLSINYDEGSVNFSTKSIARKLDNKAEYVLQIQTPQGLISCSIAKPLIDADYEPLTYITNITAETSDRLDKANMYMDPRLFVPVTECGVGVDIEGDSDILVSAARAKVKGYWKKEKVGLLAWTWTWIPEVSAVPAQYSKALWAVQKYDLILPTCTLENNTYTVQVTNPLTKEVKVAKKEGGYDCVYKGISLGNSETEAVIQVALTSLNKYIYYAKDVEVEVNDEGKQVPPTGMYPAWIADIPWFTTENKPIGDISKSQSSPQMHAILATESANLVANISLEAILGSYIEKVTPSLSRPYSLNSYHIFDGFEPKVTLSNQQTDICTITLNDEVKFTYDVVTRKFSGHTGTFTEAYKITDTKLPQPGDAIQRIRLNIQNTTRHLATLGYSKIGSVSGFVPESLGIQSQVGDKVTLSLGYGDIDLATHTLSNSTVISFINTEQVGEEYRYYIAENNSAVLFAVAQGIIKKSLDNLVYSSLSSDDTHHIVNYTLKDKEYKLFVDKDTTLNLKYATKDIRTNEEEKFIYQNDLEDTKMFVKQFWSNDSRTENYWWVDAEHILELTSEDIILWEKVKGEVDDWNGDKWQISNNKKVPRQNFFGSKDLYYTVSNAKNATKGPWLFKLQAIPNAIRILYVDNILEIDFHKMQSDFKLKPTTVVENRYWRQIDIPLVNIALGQSLIDSTLCSYNRLDAAALISGANISSTIVKDTFMIGIANGQGLDQWTIKIKNNNIIEIVTGYGYVGLNGSLTGGQLPSFVCGATGFNSTVYSVDDLNKLKGLDVTNSSESLPTLPPSNCYGTGSTVWFINKAVNSIISHYEYEADTGKHMPIELALKSSVERRYESASFQASCLFDVLPTTFSFSTLFEDLFKAPGMKLIEAVALPILFAIDARYSMMAYINHSFGQYAYVWRNSNKDYLPDGKTDQDIKFLQDKYTQTFEHSADKVSAWVQIILKAIAVTDDIAHNHVVNKNQNQTTTDDSKGRKFSQFFTENIDETLSALLVTEGANISVKSSLAQAYTLDMFYSIDNGTQCFAGPGFVNHNLIGQCVAQSATDSQITGKSVGYWCSLKSISKVVINVKVKALKAISGVLNNLASGVAPASAGSNPGPEFNIGLVLAIPFKVAAAALDGLIIVQDEALEVLEQLATAVGPSDGTAYTVSSIKDFNLAVEGTHTYGNKPMNFFWPAFGVDKPIKYTNETVVAQGKGHTQKISLTGKRAKVDMSFKEESSETRGFKNTEFIKGKGKLPLQGNLKSVTVQCKGVSYTQVAPRGMAVVEGAKSFLSSELFKNEQIGVSPVTFPPPPIHDYVIDDTWQLGYTAGDGEIIWVSCDDTKLVDGPPSNIVVSPDFCGVASSYIALEVKKEYDHRYLRPYAVTPQAIALNLNRLNCIQDQQVCHAFDGQGNRLIQWTGGSGMDKAVLYHQYLFQVNDSFKRSNILPPSQFFGIFSGPPSVAIRSHEPFANLTQALSTNVAAKDVPGEQKELTRFSIPVHSEMISTLPAMVRMLAPYKLNVIEGITSLTTEIRTTQTRYKAPTSIDFNIYSKAYRATEEFLCELTLDKGIVAVRDICATAGLVFIGATTREAFFWSPATRLYYSFSDGQEIQKRDIMNRFIDVKKGLWDFVNQEVMMKVLTKEGIIVTRLDKGMEGEVFPPNKTIYSDGSDYKLLSMAGGTVYQGPKRFIVNRFVILDYMLKDIKRNSRRAFNYTDDREGAKNWIRVGRDTYDQDRNYGWEYHTIDTVKIGSKIEEQDSPWNAIRGWTHNPKGLVTSMLGLNDNTDCRFEWVLTFAWTDQMDMFYEQNEYATVNIKAETVTQGGVVNSNTTHIYLFRECFTRTGNAGHYTFKFQSNNGIGNRERLYLWGDSITALQSLKLRCTSITVNRTQSLHTQVDVQKMIEA